MWKISRNILCRRCYSSEVDTRLYHFTCNHTRLNQQWCVSMYIPKDITMQRRINNMQQKLCKFCCIMSHQLVPRVCGMSEYTKQGGPICISNKHKNAATENLLNHSHHISECHCEYSEGGGYKRGRCAKRYLAYFSAYCHNKCNEQFQYAIPSSMR